MSPAVRHGAMRAGNLAAVLGELDRRGPLTRAALAEFTGLTKTTVSKLVAYLIDAGMAVESGTVRDGERGRPGVVVRLSGHRVAALGLEINVDYLAGCVVDLSRTVRLLRTQPVDNRAATPEDVIARLRELASALLVDAGELGLSVAGGMVALPGPVDRATGAVHRAPNLGWRDVAVTETLDLPLPVVVDNEANLAALGELWFGSGASLGDFLHVSGEIGIGAGLVVQGELFRGAHGFAGELGHVVVSPEGPACRCGGSGCLERYAGQDALLAPGEDLAGLVARLRGGDAAAAAACERAGSALGVALTSAVNLIDPDTIVLGGIFAPLYGWVSAPAGRAMRERLGQMRRRVPTLVVSRVGADAATLGGAGQVIQRIIADPGAHLVMLDATPSSPAR
ncbi:ROK family transcriptional regulator [Sphaerisporangium sp. TRM90804]|uniref:ROK family transcriptional regulator n=1 Tax=Sphaerisporangium sp. TRM90804 TaxID=3031113 RepID=UPI00244C11FE|nr:ROK family transcriptional regulator [Sphaerisporangium sp. TRM90804]MDH2426587.1 ROK family transcriptional regulator [Sphaerisporangium sp. TRM90804]